MNTLVKIAGLCIIFAGLSASAYAAATVTQSAAGAPLVFSAAAAGLPDLSFSCSGNTILAGASDATTYSIGAVSSKTDTTNGMQYGMDESFNGYYQTVKTGDSITLTFDSWTKMGGSGGSGS